MGNGGLACAEASAPAAGESLAQMEQEAEEDAVKEERLYAKVQAAQEQEAEDDAFREEQSFDRAHAPGPALRAEGSPDVPSESAVAPHVEVPHMLPYLLVQAMRQSYIRMLWSGHHLFPGHDTTLLRKSLCAECAGACCCACQEQAHEHTLALLAGQPRDSRCG